MNIFARFFGGSRAPAASPSATAMAFGGPDPYADTLAPSNNFGDRTPIVGMFGVPSSYGSWQQPVTAPPIPVAGPKGILADQKIVPTPKRLTVLFSPATAYDPSAAL